MAWKGSSSGGGGVERSATIELPVEDFSPLDRNRIVRTISCRSAFVGKSNSPCLLSYLPLSTDGFGPWVSHVNGPSKTQQELKGSRP